MGVISIVSSKPMVDDNAAAGTLFQRPEDNPSGGKELEADQVGDIHRPDLVWSRDLDAAQQIRIDLVPRLGLRRARTAIERLYPHPLHQRLHVTTADLAPLGSQQASQHSRAGE